MLKRKTILLMVSAIALFGLVALFEGNRSVTGSRSDEADAPADSTLPGDGELLFPFAEEDVERVEVQREGETLVFEKLEDETWEMRSPEEAMAESGAIAFLLSQVTNTSTHTLSVDTSGLRDFGLQNPEATAIFTANDKIYQLSVGDSDFTGDQLYVRTEPPTEKPEDAGQIKVHVVSGGMRNAVNRPTADWLLADETAAEPADEAADEATNEAADEAPSEASADGAGDTEADTAEQSE